LLYRYHRLPQALNGQATGLERVLFHLPPSPHGRQHRQHVDLEIHADMAVAYAIWHHDKICRDKEFLYHEGIEMLLQICRFLASAGGWSPIHGDFGFYGVMGPDEFHTMVNHNCYTNVMGKKAFEFTLSVLAEMQREAPEQYQQAIKNRA
jgi:maltose phosphorylase